jgi:hypothetical protein
MELEMKSTMRHWFRNSSWKGTGRDVAGTMHPSIESVLHNMTNMIRCGVARNPLIFVDFPP